jgi:hypothetical protein
VKSFYEKNVFEEEDFNALKEIAFKDLSSDNIYFSEAYSRYYAITDFPENIKAKIVDLANKKFNTKDLDIVYTHAVKYQIVNGIKPSLKKHLDNLPSTHVIDLCVETTLPDWGLTVGDDFFQDDPNSAVFLYGKEDIHFRPDYTSEDENDYCIMFLINLAPPGHWGHKAADSLKLMPEHLRQKMIDQLTPHHRKKDMNK